MTLHKSVKKCYKQDTSVNGMKAFLALWFFGILLGFSYLIASGYIFAITLAVCTIFILTFLRPEYGFYLVILVLMEEMCNLFFLVGSNPIFMFFVYHIVLLITVVIWFFYRLAGLREKRNPTSVDGIIWMIVTYELVSLLWTPEFFLGLLYGISLVLNLLLFYMTSSIVKDEESLSKFVKVWIFAAVIISAGVVVNQWFEAAKVIYFTRDIGINISFAKVESRPSGFAGVDHAAGFIVSAIFLAIISIITSKKKAAKFLYFLCLFFFLYALVITTTRGALIGLVGGLFIFFFFHPLIKGKLIKYSFLSLILAVAVILIAKPGYIDRILISFGYTGELYFSDRSFFGHEADISAGKGLSGFDIRLAHWKKGFEELIEHPLKFIFGMGISGFIHYSKDVGGPEIVNVYLAFLFDMGIFGVCFFIFLVFIILRHTYPCLVNLTKSKSLKYSQHLLTASISILVAEVGIHGLVDYDLNSIGSKIVWLSLGLIMSVFNILKKEEEASVLSQK